MRRRQQRPGYRSQPVAWLLVAAMIVLGSGSVLAREAPESFSAIVGDLLPAVVNISTTQVVEGGDVPPGIEATPLERFFGDRFSGGSPRSVNALGSGFIIDPEGYIVTNNHVVAKAQEIRAILSDGRILEAVVVGTDPLTDLALLKVDAGEPLASVDWGTSEDTRIGDWVVAIGNPFGLGSTVTAGVLSGRARNLHAGPFDDFLQTDAAINRGSSGGPLFDTGGAVIGVNSVILSPTGGNVGIGFAIPTSTAKSVIEQLRRRGVVRRGWLGVEIQPLTKDIAAAVGLKKSHGALVAGVVEGGPAEDAGLEPGDVIVGFGGKSVVRMRDLPRIVADTKIASTAVIDVWRDGKPLKLKATVGERKGPESAGPAGPERPVQAGSLPALGITVAPLDDAMRKKLGLQEEASGVVVLEVVPDGPSARNGMRPGDIIVEVDRNPVSNPQELVAQLRNAQRKGRVAALLRISRGGVYRFIGVPVA